MSAWRKCPKCGNETMREGLSLRCYMCGYKDDDSVSPVRFRSKKPQDIRNWMQCQVQAQMREHAGHCTICDDKIRRAQPTKGK